MRPPRILRMSAVVSALLTILAGCSVDRVTDAVDSSARIASPLRTQVAPGDRLPVFDPANFVAGVDHPYFPLVPGTVMTYDEEPGPGAERVVIEVLAAPKSILGIAATVVRDRVWVDGELVEDTDDWFAQDADGNVWYLGEAVKNYEGGVLVDTEGSWEAGVDGATAGIQMLAAPASGAAYFQEYAEGIAEDEARVRSTDEHVTVAYGAWDDCVQVLEWTKLEPGHRGYKYYAAGVGLVLESSAKAGGTRGRVELTAVEHP